MTQIIPFTQTKDKGDNAAAEKNGRVVEMKPKTPRDKVAFQVSEIMAGMKTVKGVATPNSFREGCRMASENIQEFVVEQEKEGKPRNPMQKLLWLAAALKKMSSH